MEMHYEDREQERLLTLYSSVLGWPWLCSSVLKLSSVGSNREKRFSHPLHMGPKSWDLTDHKFKAAACSSYWLSDQSKLSNLEKLRV